MTKNNKNENPPKPTGRAGTSMLGAHVGEEVHRRFKILAAEQGKTVQSLLLEAVNDIFVKYDKGLGVDKKEV